MTKKSNRPKAKSSAKTTAKAKTNDIVTTEVIPAPPPLPSPSRPSRTPKLSRSQIAAERIEDEYAYIADDLRRVFLLALAIFALLIVLNIVISRIGI
ncbi:MAG: hypothetical protein KA586_00895 [Candidatus Promineofilum sp.]|nr:hypothetical protein [Promineifilum sp.]